MEITAVGVSATDLHRTVAFYELLGFAFPPVEADTMHLESGGAVRLMIDAASLLEELNGAPPRPGTASAFALQADSPAEGDEGAARGAGPRRDPGPPPPPP